MPSSALLSLFRPALRLIAIALPLAAIPAAQASTLTYDVTLSPTSGTYGGSGTISLSSAPSEFGISTFSQANGTLQNLSFTIGNQTFSLAGDPSATVEFLDGKIYNISFAQTIGSSPHRFTLDTSGVYAFYYNNGFSESSGDITAALASAPPDSIPSQPPAASPTPEPGTILLLATALVGGGFLIVRRRRSTQAA